jgi:hypothetical protein
MSTNDNDLVGSVQRTITFLRMAAIEMRRLANEGSWSAGDAAQLRHIADQCDQDADELSERVAASEPGN